MSSRTGDMLVNHPTVRDRSMPKGGSSLPWPSTSTRMAPLPCAPCRRRQSAIATARPVSSTSWMPQWNAAGTRVNNSAVTDAGSVSANCPAVPTTSRAGSSEPATNGAEGALSIPRQKASSSTRRASTACSASQCAHRRKEVPRGGSIRRLAARARSPRCRQVRHQDTPRHPVDHQVMDTQQQTSRRTCSRIEPHRLHHDARGRRKSQFGRMRLLRNAGPQRDMVEAGYIDPSQARACINGAGGCNLEREVAALAASGPKPQSIMMIEHGLQRAEELILPQARRDLQHQRLVEAVDRTSPFGQPAHDRCRRQRPGRHIRLARRRLRGRHYSRRQRPPLSDAQTPPAA